MSGRPEVWSAVKLATESVRNGDIDTAQGVLDAAGCTVPTGDLCEGCYDEAGALYQLPGWVCADPIGEFSDHEERPKDKPVEEDTERGQEEEDADVVARREEKGKEREVRVGEGVKVKARLSDRASDVVVWIGKEEGARGVVRRVREEAGVSDEAIHSYLLPSRHIPIRPQNPQVYVARASIKVLTSELARPKHKNQNRLHGQDPPRQRTPPIPRLARRPRRQRPSLLIIPRSFQNSEILPFLPLPPTQDAEDLASSEHRLSFAASAYGCFQKSK